MSKVINVDFRTKEEKRAAFKAKLNEKIQDGKDWFMRNKEYVITLTPVIVGCPLRNGLRLPSVRKTEKDLAIF